MSFWFLCTECVTGVSMYYLPTLRVAFSLIWLFAPERSSGKRWSIVMSETLRRRFRGKLRTPSEVFFSCCLTWTTGTQIKLFER